MFGKDMKILADILKKIYKAETSHANWCRLIVIAVFAVIVGAALIVYAVDPFYHYRSPSFYDKVYYEIYATAPGLLRDEEFDTIMLGTSMVRNFFVSDIDGAFGGKSIKIAGSGATTQDLKKFFDVALAEKKGKLKRVVLSLDTYPLNKTDSNSHYRDFDYMYKKGHAEDYRYLFSRKTFSRIFYLIKRKWRPKRRRAHQTDRNRMFATDYDGKPYGLQEILKDAAHNQELHHTLTPYNEKAYRQNLQKELLPMFDENPQIDFIVFLPPYHIYTFCQSAEFNELEPLIAQRSEVMKEVLKRKNVTLFDFQPDASYTCDDSLFCDVQHFSNYAARRIFADILAGRGRILTDADVDRNELALRKLIEEKMPDYIRHLEEYKAE